MFYSQLWHSSPGLRHRLSPYPIRVVVHSQANPPTLTTRRERESPTCETSILIPYILYAHISEAIYSHELATGPNGTAAHSANPVRLKTLRLRRCPPAKESVRREQHSEAALRASPRKSPHSTRSAPPKADDQVTSMSVPGVHRRKRDTSLFCQLYRERGRQICKEGFPSTHRTQLTRSPQVCVPSRLWWGAMCIRLVIIDKRDTTCYGCPYISHFAMVFIVPQTK